MFTIDRSAETPADAKTVVGIDPGVKGGVAFIDEDGRLEVMALPHLLITTGGRTAKTRNELDAARLLDQLATWAPDLVILERMTAIPYQDSASVGRLMAGFGELRGLLKVLARTSGAAYVEAVPRSWKNVILAGTAKDKKAAIAKVQSVYPDTSLLATPKSRKPSDGLADAACMALFGRYLLSHPKVACKRYPHLVGLPLWPAASMA